MSTNKKKVLQGLKRNVGDDDEWRQERQGMRGVLRRDSGARATATERRNFFNKDDVLTRKLIGKF